MNQEPQRAEAVPHAHGEVASNSTSLDRSERTSTASRPNKHLTNR